MRVRIGCELTYELPATTPALLCVAARERDFHRLLCEDFDLSPEIPFREERDGFGNRIWRVTPGAGEFRLRYDAHVEVDAAPDPVLPGLPGTPIDALPTETLPYLLPSRHCPSDLVMEEAWQRFGATPEGWARVQAICDFIHETVAYGGDSTSATTGLDAYHARLGVCRDFAHIAVMLCRAVNIPARYVCGYLPEIGVPPDSRPMDFHAWFEAYLDGSWRTFDARHNVPRIGRVVIARGRDAVDAAFATLYGTGTLAAITVWAEELPEPRC
jgi:transglutaminase-like putative cysteine protease